MNLKTRTPLRCSPQTRPRPLRGCRAPCEAGDSPCVAPAVRHARHWSVRPNDHRHRDRPFFTQPWMVATHGSSSRARLSTPRRACARAMICSLNSAGYAFLVLGMISTLLLQSKSVHQTGATPTPELGWFWRQMNGTTAFRVRRQGFSESWSGFVTEALVRFLSEFRRPRLGAATGVFGLSVS
jgi:hypothetical protein